MGTLWTNIIIVIIITKSLISMIRSSGRTHFRGSCVWNSSSLRVGNRSRPAVKQTEHWRGPGNRRLICSSVFYERSENRSIRTLIRDGHKYYLFSKPCNAIVVFRIKRIYDPLVFYFLYTYLRRYSFLKSPVITAGNYIGNGTSEKRIHTEVSVMLGGDRVYFSITARLLETCRQPMLTQISAFVHSEQWSRWAFHSPFFNEHWQKRQNRKNRQIDDFILFLTTDVSD